MIKGVTNQVRLPRLGKIRLGIKVVGDKSAYPKAVDYFVCPPEVEKVFGEKPKELRVMFPTEDPAQWASQFYRCYSSTRGLICKGDGEKALAMVNSKTGEIAAKDAKETELREVPCDPEKCAKFQAKACKPVMNLQFLLPEVIGLGIWQLDTSSYNSIRNVNSAVQLYKGILGRISLLPLTLRVAPQEAQVEGKKKNIFVLHLEANYTLAEIVGKLQGLPIGQALLPEPDQEAPDDLFPTEIIEEKTPTKVDAPEASKTGTKEPGPSQNTTQTVAGIQVDEALKDALDNIVKPPPPQKPNWPLIVKYCKALGVPVKDLPKALGLSGDDVNQWKGSHEEALDKLEVYSRKNHQYVGPAWKVIKLV